MAEDEKELSLDVDEEDKPKSKLFILIIIVVLVLAGVGGAVFFMMGGDDENTDDTVEDDAEAEMIKLEAIYVPIKPAFVVNFASPGASRFLQIEVSLMTRDQEVVKLIELHLPLIRNNLISLFSSQEFESVMSPDGKLLLRDAALVEVQKVIQEEYDSPGVEQVLFTSFVVQ